MSYTIRNSLDVEFTKAPAIAIAGPSGSGKTESAMRLARGYCGTEKFVIIDTEEKRALYKKARYQPWDWIDFQPPFTPENCREVLDAVKGYKAVIWDSGSSEYIGEGGLQDIADETLERMSHGDPKRMEALVAPSWKDAKRRHKQKLMSFLIRYPTMLIVCLRAEPKVKFVKVDGKTTIVDAGYQPLCEKMFMYEMLVGCKMTADNAGVPEHIKQLEPDLKTVFLADRQIDEQTGKRLAEWAAGGSKMRGENAGISPDRSVSRTPKRDTVESGATGVTAGETATYITPDQVSGIETLCEVNDIPLGRVKTKCAVDRLAMITTGQYPRLVDWLDGIIKAKEKA